MRLLLPPLQRNSDGDERSCKDRVQLRRNWQQQLLTTPKGPDGPVNYLQQRRDGGGDDDPRRPEDSNGGDAAMSPD